MVGRDKEGQRGLDRFQTDLNASQRPSARQSVRDDVHTEGNAGIRRGVILILRNDQDDFIANPFQGQLDTGKDELAAEYDKRFWFAHA